MSPTLDTLSHLQERVDQLYHFRYFSLIKTNFDMKTRDHFFENHPLEAAADKPRQIQDHLTEALSNFDVAEAAGVAEDRARYLYLRGRLLNVSGDFSSAAETCLSRSVKLNPNLVDAWNELGESYMRKEDWTTARTCFEVRQ